MAIITKGMTNVVTTEYIAVENFLDVNRQIRDSLSYIYAPSKKKGSIGNRILKNQLDTIIIQCVDQERRRLCL